MNHYIFLLCSLLVANNSFAASFDCKKASTQIEIIICNNSELSRLDEDVSEIYRLILEKDASIKSSQEGWIKSRDMCESDFCLINSYRDRVDELNFILRDVNEDSRKEIKTHEEDLANFENEIQNTLKPPIHNTPNPQPPVKNISSSDRLLSFLTVFMILGGVILYFGISLKCPKCGKWFSAKRTHKELIDESKGRKTVTREDVHTSGGRELKRVQRQEQIDIIKKKYEISHRCISCNHKWQTIEYKDVEL